MSIGTELSAADEEMFTIIPRPLCRKGGANKEEEGDEKGGGKDGERRRRSALPLCSSM